jgi:hypothetical protein
MAPMNSSWAVHNQYAQLPLKGAAGQPKRCAYLSAPGVGRYIL